MGSRRSPAAGSGRLRLEPALLVAGLGLEALFLGLAALGDLRARSSAFLALYLVAFAVYLVALGLVRRRPPTRRALALVLGFAAAFRLTLLAAEPTLSEDVVRYRWDGAVLGHLENPYRYAPSHPARAPFAPLAAGMNHPDVPTVYPPLAEAVFAAVVALWPGTRALRLAMVLAEAIVLLALLGLLARQGRPGTEVLGYAWCPLAVVETAGSGHLEPLAIGLLLLGLSYLSQGRKNLSTLLLVASALCKYLALAVALALGRRLGLARLGAVLLLTAAAFLPFLADGTWPWHGLERYAASWQFNAPLFATLVGAIDALDLIGSLQHGLGWVQSALGGARWLEPLHARIHPQALARLLVGAAMLAACLAAARRHLEPVAAAAAAVFAFLLLTPTLHPWYVLWGLPFALLLRSRAFLLLAALVAISYHGSVGAAGHGAAITVELSLFYLVLGHDALRLARAARGRPPAGPGPTAPRRHIIGPPSPFPRRSAWRRLRDDHWRRWSGALGVFWRSRWRWPVLLLLLLALAAVAAASLVRLEPVAGVVVGPGGTPRAGVEVEVEWYRARSAVLAEGTRYLRDDVSVDTDLDRRESVLGRWRAVSDGEGRFRLAGATVLGWPGQGPAHLRLRLVAADPVSGEPYRVRRFLLADATEVAGALDTGRLDRSRSLAALLDPIQVPPPGRVGDIAVSGDRVATAEGQAGIRLYRRGDDGPPRLLSHRLLDEVDRVEAVGFAGRRLLAFHERGVELLDPGEALRPVGRLPGPASRLLDGDDRRFAVLAGSHVLLYDATSEPPRLRDRVYLGGEARTEEAIGPESLRLTGALLLRRHGDGTVRASDVDGRFRAPATLTEPGGAAIDFDLVAAEGPGRGPWAVVVSAAGLATYDLSRTDVTRRAGRLDLADVEPLRVVDGVVLGARRTVLLRLTGGEVTVERAFEHGWDELGAMSARRRGDRLLVPRLGEVEWREESVGMTWDPVAGQTVDKQRRLRDSALLEGVSELDLSRGTVRDLPLDPPRRVSFRTDGSNRRLVQAVDGHGRTLYGGADGTLVLAPW